MRQVLLAFALLIVHLVLSKHVEKNEHREIEEIRKLLLLGNDNSGGFVAVECPGGGPLNSFLLDIQINPQGGFRPYSCTDVMKRNMTTNLNELLYYYGVGPAGVGDDAVFLAKVCSLKQRRRLATTGFRWPGGGTCRSCKGDNQDHRRLQILDANWFPNIYAPKLEITLQNAISTTFVQNFTSCLGISPQVIVNVYPVLDVLWLKC